MNEEKQNQPDSASPVGSDFERLVGGAEASARAGYRRRTFKGTGTGKPADSAVNRQLTARRALMEKRVKRGRIVLWIFAALSLAEIVLQLFSNVRLPLSCTLSALLTVYGIISLPCLIAALLPIAYFVALAIGFRSDRMELPRKFLTVFLWVDFIITLALGGNAYGLDKYITTEIVCSFILHIPLIWIMMRAVRAVGALDVLPTEEMEGDPYEGLGYHDLPDEEAGSVDSADTKGD